MTNSETATVPQQTRVVPETSTRRPASLLERLGIIALIGFAPASTLFLSFSRGGYFPNSTGVAAIAFAAALVLRTTLAEHPFEGFNRQLSALLLSLALFALWQLTSALWSHDLARAFDQYNRTLLYLLALTLFGSLPRTQARTRWMVRSLAAAMTAVSAAALVSRVLPHALPTAATLMENRLSYPLTYWNADGLMFALAAILLVHLASSQNEHRVTRVIAATVFPVTAAALLLTFSRGALGFGIIGLIVYLLLGRPRGAVGALVALIPTTAVALHAAYAAELLATDRPTSAGAVSQGRHVAVTIAVCMFAAGFARAVMLPVDAWLASEGQRRLRLSRQAMIRFTVVFTTTVILVLVLSGAVGREWHQFVHGTGGAPAVTRDRLTDISGEQRTVVWGVAFHAFLARPFLGFGAGTFEQYYFQHRPITGTLTDAHELYLQTLAELGVFGFVALALVIVGILVMLARRIEGPDRPTYAVLFAAVLTWALTAGIDWDWQMAAVTLWLFIAAGSALAAPRAQDEASQSRAVPRNRTPMAVAWLVLAVAPLLIGVSYARVRASAQQFDSGNCIGARQNAFSAISLLPVRPQPYEIISFCDLQTGFPIEALQAAQKAKHYAPNVWDYEYGLALALAANGLDPRRAASRALKLNPRESIVQEAVSTFQTGTASAWEQDVPVLLLGALQSGRLTISSL